MKYYNHCNRPAECLNEYDKALEELNRLRDRKEAITQAINKQRKYIKTLK